MGGFFFRRPVRFLTPPAGFCAVAAGAPAGASVGLRSDSAIDQVSFSLELRLRRSIAKGERGAIPAGDAPNRSPRLALRARLSVSPGPPARGGRPSLPG